MSTNTIRLGEEHPSLGYVAPFALFLLFVAVGSQISLDSFWGAPLRVVILGIVCVMCWPRELPLATVRPLASSLVGAGVFLLWIAPDVLIPGYRDNILFSNPLMGQVHSAFQASSLHNPWQLGWRTLRAVAIVPIVEELFWRGWLMRWMISSNFRQVPLGTYSPVAFWVTALLFASEHGPYWDVGFLTGVIYNLWMIRTRSVADCILMHAVTNGLLSAYVIVTAQWQYWQ